MRTSSQTAMLLQEVLIKQGESIFNVIKQHKPEELSHPLSLFSIQTCFLSVRQQGDMAVFQILWSSVTKKEQQLSVINHNRRFFLHFASGVNIEKKVAKKINSLKLSNLWKT